MNKEYLKAALSMVEQTLSERAKELEEAEAELVHITEPCRMPEHQDVADRITRLREDIRCLQIETMEYNEAINE